jgi:hypothetical protein
MKTYLHLLHSFQLVLELEMFLTKVITNKTIHILGSFFFLIMEKYSTAGQATDGNILRRMRFSLE